MWVCGKDILHAGAQAASGYAWFFKAGVMMPPCLEDACYQNENDFDYGGLAFRVDVPGPGAYHLEVELSSAPDGERIAVSGMNPVQISTQGFWDAAQLIPRVHCATFMGNVWNYDYVCGQSFWKSK